MGKNMVCITCLLIWMFVSSSRSRERYHEDVLRRVNLGICVSDFVRGVNLGDRLGPPQAPVNLTLAVFRCRTQDRSFNIWDGAR